MHGGGGYFIIEPRYPLRTRFVQTIVNPAF